MSLYKKIVFFLLPVVVLSACTRENLKDTSFVSGASSVSKVSAMFTITQDNTGLVTIAPSGEGSTSYDVAFGDTSKTPVSVLPGYSVKHIYAEGNYQVKITGHDLKGGTTTTTQQLTVSYITPEDLTVNVSTSNLTVSVSATAKYATFYQVYYGDQTNVTPEPYTQTLAGQTVTHNYTNAGTYIVRVVALSGGSETATFLDTIHVAKQIDLPVTFEDPNTDYTLSDFGQEASSLTADPANASNHVAKSVKTSGAATWAGVTVGGALGFANPVPLKANAAKMSVMVYSPAVGLDIKLKVEDHNDGTHSVETDVLSTKANQWETLTFDLSNVAAGTPAFNPSYNYDKASLFFDFNNPGTGEIFYFDNLQYVPATLSQIDLPVTFESKTVDYTMSDFGGDASTLVVDPTDNTNHVMQSIKTAGAMTWAGTTMGPNGFATVIPKTNAPMMTVRVYSPAAGLDIKLKLEEDANGANSVETDVLTTKANQWETLTFDFSKNATGTPAWSGSYNYQKCSIFFDFGNAGTGSTFYWDDVTLL